MCSPSAVNWTGMRKVLLDVATEVPFSSLSPTSSASNVFVFDEPETCRFAD